MPIFSCGRSVYIDWRMVVVGVNCPTPYKQGGGIVRAGEMSGGNMSEGGCHTLKCYMVSVAHRIFVCPCSSTPLLRDIEESMPCCTIERWSSTLRTTCIRPSLYQFVCVGNDGRLTFRVGCMQRERAVDDVDGLMH